MESTGQSPLFQEAETKFLTNEYSLAIELYNKCLNTENNSGNLNQCYQRKIQSYVKLNKLKEAKDEYNNFSRIFDFEQFSQTYYEIIHFFRIEYQFPFILMILDSLFQEITPNFKLIVEKVNCLIVLNRLIEAESEINIALEIFKSSPSEENDICLFITCYYKIKNKLNKFNETLNFYYEYHKLKINNSKINLHPIIFIELGIAFINLSQYDEFNNEILNNYFKNNDTNQYECYNAYLKSYIKIKEGNYNEGKNILKEITEIIKTKKLKEDISILYELYGDLLCKFKLQEVENHLNDFLNYSWHQGSLVWIYIKIAKSISNYYNEQKKNGLTTTPLTINNSFYEKVSTIIQYNKDNNNCYNLYELISLQALNYYEIKKDKGKFSFDVIKEVMEALLIEQIKQKYTIQELYTIYITCIKFVQYFKGENINHLELYPKHDNDNNNPDVYYGTFSKEICRVKLYKYNLNDIKELESAFIEIFTNKTIFFKESKAPLQIKKGYQHLLPIKSVFILEKPKFIYLIYPPCPGGSLYELLSNPEIELLSKDIKNILISIAKTIQVLHWSNVIHKNIKSENIYFKEQYRKGINLEIYLGGLDMINKEYSEDDISYNICAPEFFTNEKINQSVDIYSFGMLIWEINIKEKPYEGLSKEQTIKQRKKNLGLDKLKKKVSVGLYKLFEKCISKIPLKRPTIEQVINELNQIIL